MSLFSEGWRTPCNLPSTDYDLPPWYECDKFRRGQEYFHNHRFGILFSNFTAIISLMCVPKGLKTLIATGLTGCLKSARKRYLSTLAYTLTWYYSDLKPGSPSGLIQSVNNTKNMDKEIELTKAEQIAKDHFILLAREGHVVPCDYDVSAIDESLPSWYDKAVFTRGQNYYQQNRAGILNSNLIGLICLLAEPKGLKVLQSTGRSSTPELARKRYLSTIVHTLTWYDDIDLSPGSKSFESLKRVRKLHYLSSKSAAAKGIGFITQTELVATTFGFMGLALIRPHMLGIRADNDDDRKAFVHFWAVVCYMIGINDRFNMCLLPFDAVLVFSQIIMRYILMPIIQLETPDFKDMTQAMLKGMKSYLHTTNYEVDLFSARRLLIVPGYQYRTDNTLEVHCRSLFTQKELDECNKYAEKWMGSSERSYLSADIPVIEVIRVGQVNNSLEIEENVSEIHDRREDNSEMTQYLGNLMKLGPSEHVTIRYINYEREWQSCLNDSKFSELSTTGKLSIRLKCLMCAMYTTTIGRYLLESILGVVLEKIKKAADRYHTVRQVQIP